MARLPPLTLWCFGAAAVAACMTAVVASCLLVLYAWPRDWRPVTVTDVSMSEEVRTNGDTWYTATASFVFEPSKAADDHPVAGRLKHMFICSAITHDACVASIQAVVQGWRTPPTLVNRRAPSCMGIQATVPPYHTCSDALVYLLGSWLTLAMVGLGMRFWIVGRQDNDDLVASGRQDGGTESSSPVGISVAAAMALLREVRSMEQEDPRNHATDEVTHQAGTAILSKQVI